MVGMDNGNAVTVKYMGVNFKRCYFFIISLLFGCIASYVFAENERKLLGEKLQELNVFSKNEDLSFIYFGDVGCGYCRKYLKHIQPKLKTQYFSDEASSSDKFTELEVSYLLGSFESSELATKHLMCAETLSQTLGANALSSNNSNVKSLKEQLREKIISVPESKVLESLPGFVKQLGLLDIMDEQKMKQCVESKETQLALQKGNDLGNRIGLQGIPQFFIGYQKDGQWLAVETLVGFQPYKKFEQTLEKIKAFAQRSRLESEKE